MSPSNATDIAIKTGDSQAEIISIPKKQSLIRYFSAFTQFLTWPLAYVFFHSLYKVTITGRENLKKFKRPFMITSNHIAYFDSFFFRLVLGGWTRHLPLRFMAVDKFDYKYLNFLSRIGVIKIVYALFGVFVVVPGRGLEENIKVAIDIIEDRGNIVIYPEGKIVKKQGIAPFKRGAAVLIQKTKVPIIPISLRIVSEEGLARKRFIANIGEPLWIPDNMNEENITQVLHNSVSNLYDRV